MQHEVIVRAFWDDEAKVYVAEGMNYPGIVTESESFDGLIAKLKVIIPEIIDENSNGDAIPFRLLGEVCAIANHNG